MRARALSRIALSVTIAFGTVAAAPAAGIGFQVFLLNGVTGRLSPDVLANSTPLGNVVSGDLSSTSTFVVVKVALGADSPLPQQARVRLLATVKGNKPGRPMLDSTAKLGAIGSDGTAYVGFWLADTGCKPISLTATLLGARSTGSGKAVLPFACYE